MKTRDLIIAAIGLAVVIFFGVGYYKNMAAENVPGENKSRLANRYLEDGKYSEALAAFDESLAINPTYKDAHMGKAITLMQMERFDESRESFNKAIELDEKFALAYANRGILNDRTGNYEAAMKDYRRAVELNPKLAKGPGRLWKFLHNVWDDPPSIADRADYIEAELNKPEEERLLRVPEIDAQQRMYKK